MLGRRKLSDIRPEHLVEFFAVKRQELAHRTIKYCFTTLRRALDMAVEWGAVPRTPARSIKAPMVPRVEIILLKIDEVTQLLSSAEAHGDPLAELYTMAVLSGCRMGELLALRWDDLNLEDGMVSVRRTLVGVHKGNPIVADPKTPRSRRNFKLSHDALDALRRQRDRQTWERQRISEGYLDHGLVFATPLGSPLDGSNVLKRFKQALKRAELATTYTFHSLRHTAATMMLAAGVNPKTVADRLGHASAAFTLDRHCHAVQSLDEDAAERLQVMMQRAREKAI